MDLTPPSGLRVLHVFDHSLPLHSGYTFRSAAILREQRRLGWQTHHLTSPKHQLAAGPLEGASEERVDDLLFHRTTEPPAAWARGPLLTPLEQMRRTARRLREVAQAVRPHLLHAHSPVLNAFPALWVARALGLPVVYEVRAFWEDAAVDHGTTHEGSLRYRLTRRLETQAFRGVDHVFTICEGLRRDIQARGIPAGRLTVIPNAVDIGQFEPGGPPDPALQAALGLQGTQVIGFIGSFYAYEGLDLLLQALPRVLAERPQTRLLLVGGGPQEKSLREQAAAMDLSRQVVFVGRVPHDQVNRYYDLIDVLAYPRHRMRLTDLVTPLKPLEAMAQQRLLVASDVGGHRELIEDGVHGRLFEAGDAPALARALLDVLADPAQAAALRAAGRRLVERERHWAASVGRYAPVYGRLCGSSAGFMTGVAS